MNSEPGQLKIGLVTPYARTSRWGVNRHIRGLAASFGEMGHDVSLIVPAEERDEARIERRRRKLSRRVSRSRTTGALTLPAPDEDEPCRLLKIPGTFHVPHSESLANLALPMDVTDRLNELLAREAFDILHLHEPYPPSLSFTALRLARCPTVATFHTSGEHFLSYQLMRPVVERFFSRLDERICTSQNTRRTVSGHFPGDYAVIQSGVDTRRYQPPAAAEPGDGPPLILYAAWGEPRKAIALLFRCLRLLPDDIPPFELAIVGGDLLLRSGRMSVPRRLRGRVDFTGFIGGQELNAGYARADVLMAPYASPGLSTAVLEAMAAATAVIVPGQGGIRELIHEGVDGLLLDHPYSYNLAATLVDLLSNRDLRLSLGENAAVAAPPHAWDLVAERTVKIYHQAHSRRRRARPSRKAIESLGQRDTILADLHTHTSFSGDCEIKPAELLAACAESGIEALAVTDHNTIEGALAAAAEAADDMHIIIGEEIKTTEGEIIGLYLSDEIPRGLTPEETIARIKQQGGLVYVPHPFDPLHLTPSYETLARNAADIDIIEVYNPRITFTSFNEKARRLARKYDIPGGAGSDCHVVEGVGTAMISLGRFNNPGELLTSLRRADIIRSDKSPLYLHSLKLLKNGRSSIVSRS